MRPLADDVEFKKKLKVLRVQLHMHIGDGSAGGGMRRSRRA